MDQIKQKLKRIIAGVLNDADWKNINPLKPSKFSLNYKLIDDLGADSLTMANIIMGAEDEFDINIMRPEKITTVGDLFRRIKRSC